MAVFTENQATQFYVAKNVVENTDKVKDAGDIKLVESKDKKSFYFEVMGPGGQLRSAVVKKDNLLWAKLTRAKAMQTDRKKVTLKLNPEINGGNPIAGQDYTMHVIFKQYIGISDEHAHVKTAAVHAYNTLTTEQFYEKMAASLYLNFVKELQELVSITVGGKVVAGLKSNPDGTKYVVDNTGAKITGSEDGIVITESIQPWTLGIQEQVPVYFDVYPTTVYLDGDEVSWGIATVGKTDTPIKNGHKIADMEYFFMGERGDQYRQIGWPNYVPTKYLVDPEQEYDTLNIHFAYVGSNESVQKSEQEIMVVGIASDITKLQTSLTGFGVTIEEVDENGVK